MLANYFPILLFLCVGCVMGIMPILFGLLLGRHKPSFAKNQPYECGFEPFEPARITFDIRFYLVALLFILFDLEMAFLFPWAVVFRSLPISAVVAMGGFLGLLIVGLIYEWKKGALEWE